MRYSFYELMVWLGPIQGMLIHEWVCYRLCGHRYKEVARHEYADGCFDIIDICSICKHPSHR